MPWSSTIVGVLVGAGVAVGTVVGVGSGVAVSSTFGVGASGTAVAVGILVGSEVGVGLAAAVADLANRSLTVASTVAPTFTVGGAGDRGTRVARSGSSALEQPMMNTAAAKNTTIKILCFAFGITILGTSI